MPTCQEKVKVSEGKTDGRGAVGPTWCPLWELFQGLTSLIKAIRTHSVGYIYIVYLYYKRWEQRDKEINTYQGLLGGKGFTGSSSCNPHHNP